MKRGIWHGLHTVLALREAANLSLTRATLLIWTGFAVILMALSLLKSACKACTCKRVHGVHGVHTCFRCMAVGRLSPKS